MAISATKWRRTCFECVRAHGQTELPTHGLVEEEPRSPGAGKLTRIAPEQDDAVELPQRGRREVGEENRAGYAAIAEGLAFEHGGEPAPPFGQADPRSAVAELPTQTLGQIEELPPGGVQGEALRGPERVEARAQALEPRPDRCRPPRKHAQRCTAQALERGFRVFGIAIALGDLDKVA